MYLEVLPESFIWLKGRCYRTVWSSWLPLVLEALNNTGEKSFKVRQSDISWLPLPKKTRRNALKPSSGSPSCEARNSKDLSLLKIRRVWCVIEEGLLSSLVDPPCVCPLSWLTVRDGSLCWWRQNTSFVCLVIHGVFCLRYPWTALTHWGFH